MPYFDLCDSSHSLEDLAFLPAETGECRPLSDPISRFLGSPEIYLKILSGAGKRGRPTIQVLVIVKLGDERGEFE